MRETLHERICANNLVQENTVTSSPAGIGFLIIPTGSPIGNTLREHTIALNTCGLKGPVSGKHADRERVRGERIRHVLVMMSKGGSRPTPLTI